MRDDRPSDHKLLPLTVSVRAAGLAFGETTLFEGLDFTLTGGRWTCLLGPSGVGKTSLLRMIAGLLPVSPGASIACDDGGSITGRAAYMAQQDLLLPWLSVLDNVTIGARLRGARRTPPEIAARARDLLRRVGLGDRADALPGACSGGMRQRAALARTLIEDRPVVLMDEPFSALDAITRLRLQDLAAELLAGRTVLLVTHDPHEALRLGHRIHVMSSPPGGTATLDDALEPPGATPRDPADEILLARHAELLRRLVAADAGGTERAA